MTMVEMEMGDSFHCLFLGLSVVCLHYPQGMGMGIPISPQQHEMLLIWMMRI
ncbi:hypothetical protein CsSME_00042521 [Camellia sinensis var. sinensis]